MFFYKNFIFYIRITIQNVIVMMLNKVVALIISPASSPSAANPVDETMGYFSTYSGEVRSPSHLLNFDWKL